MKNYLIITFILLILAFVSFLYRTYPLNEEKRKLKHVLEQSKENRSEIKKVLDHYKKGSLHYKSAIYLIQNLPGHSYYTNTPSKEFREILEIAHSSFYDNNTEQRNLKIREAWDSIQSEKNISRIHSWNKIKDINTIKANYLIPHINKSIEAWKSPWGTHLSFNEFCRYLLPYRVDTEPLENWREIITDNMPWLEKLKRSDVTAFEACCIINDSLKKMISVIPTFDKFPRQSVSNLFFSRAGNCIDISNLTTLVMRTAGIPVASIRCPGGHTWNVLLDQDGVLKDFMGAEQNPVNKFGGMYYHRLNVDMMKAYLKTFHPSEDIKELLKSGNIRDVPSFFRNPFLEDISDKVLCRGSFNIQTITKPQPDNRWLFLHQLLPNWKEGVTIDKIKNPPSNKISFKGISKKGTFFVTTFDNNKFSHISYCATKIKNDSLHIWKPNWDKRINCRITRKKPMSPKMKSFSKQLKGAIFQGSNNRNFINPINLDTIETEFQYLDGKHFQNPGKFRYIRLIPKESESIKIAELQFLDKEKVIKGKPLSMKKNNEIDNAFDNDIRTNFNGQNGDWIGMDFGKPIRITSFKILPRNNFNVIEPGDIYELFVIDTAHISMGKKKATSNFIEYNNIPENSLLYIINRSRGKEFGHFFIDEGTQNWDLGSVRNMEGAQK